MRSWEIDGGLPAAGRHYPRDLAEFSRWFSSEAAARRYLTAVRFRNGHACPRCGVLTAQVGGPRWWCGSCRRWFTVTTGTLLERTKVSLDTWLIASWFLVQTKIGMSALSVQRLTGVNYATSFRPIVARRVLTNGQSRM